MIQNIETDWIISYSIDRCHYYEECAVQSHYCQIPTL